MRDGEWSLVYGDTAITFGPADLDVVNMTAPSIGDTEIQTDDSGRPRSDGRAFGLDFRGARTIAFDLGVLGDTEVEVRDNLAALATAWRADEVRSKPGAVAEMRVRYAGRERATFGRPRRFAHSDEDFRQGFIPVVADFDSGDDLWYSISEEAVTASLGAETGGGLEGPLASPLSTTASSDRSVFLRVNGDLPAWPVITITGPISNPEVEIIGEWKMTLATNIAEGQTVVIDTRPWSRSVLRDGASIAGHLTRSSVRLANAGIRPGTHEVAFRGTSSTGTATVSVAWRDSFSTL